jgi:N utilization substance protein A
MGIQSDLMIAINQIAAERNINPEDVISAIKEAIKTGFRQDYPEEQETLLEVEINPDNEQAIRVFANKKVADPVVNKVTQISLADAKKIDKRLKDGDLVMVDVTPSGDFGRVAAQVAKQVILQKIRESEKETIMKDFVDKIKGIEYGVVQRLDGDDVIFEIHRAQAYMPAKEKIPGEYYHSGSKMKVLLKEIKVTPRGKQLIVSRSDNDFLIGLFKLEVPELSSETLEIKAIAREAGSRSKVAVFSNTEGIDPIGACVGQKGSRINAVLNDLKFGNFEEKIDIILWNEEPAVFISNALSPAQASEVIIVSSEERKVKAFVPDDQLSLAIGKEGQNVRLAAKLTGWNIDIMGDSLKDAEKKSIKAETKEKAEKSEKKAEPKKAVAKKSTTNKVAVKKTTVKKAAGKKEATTKKPVAKKASTAAKPAVKKKSATKKVIAKK